MATFELTTDEIGYTAEFRRVYTCPAGHTHDLGPLGGDVREYLGQQSTGCVLVLVEVES